MYVVADSRQYSKHSERLSCKVAPNEKAKEKRHVPSNVVWTWMLKKDLQKTRLLTFDTMMSSNYTATSRTHVQFPLPQPTNPDTETKLKPSLLVPSRSVSHEYHDHSQDAASTQPRVMDYRFPDRLFRLLDDKSNLSHILAWRPHGRCFAVYNRKEFVRSILPRHFRQTKMTSFQRQLSIYGFKRLTGSGSDKDCYYHELFLRGRPDLCSRMVRTKINGKVKKETPSPSTEPNFYSMTPCWTRMDRFADATPNTEDQRPDVAREFSCMEATVSQAMLFHNPAMTRAQGFLHNVETLDPLFLEPLGDFDWEDEKVDRFPGSRLAHCSNTFAGAHATAAEHIQGITVAIYDKADRDGLYEPVPYENLPCNVDLDLPLIRQLFIDESTHLV